MPKILVTERDLKRVIESALMQEIDGEVPATDTEAELNNDIRPLLNGPKLELIGKLTNINPNSWADKVAKFVRLGDMSRFADSAARENSQIVNDFLDKCLDGLLKNEVVVPLASGSSATTLQLRPRNKILYVRLDNVGYISDSEKEAQAPMMKLLKIPSEDITGLKNNPNLSTIIAGLEAVKDSPGLYYYESPGIKEKGATAASDILKDIVKDSQDIIKTWSTPVYRNYLYTPLLSPKVWLTVDNTASPFYTPWKMTWAACNIFIDAINSPSPNGGLTALFGMYANIRQYAETGFRPDQSDLAGAKLALNERFDKILLTHSELTRVISASLSVQLNEAGLPAAAGAVEPAVEPALRAVAKSGGFPGLARAGRQELMGIEKVQELFPILDDLASKMRISGVTYDLLGDLSRSAKDMLRGLVSDNTAVNIAKEADNILARLFVSDPPRVSLPTTPGATRPPPARGFASPKVEAAYDAIFNITMKAVGGSADGATTRDLEVLVKTLDGLNDAELRDLGRLLTPTSTSRQRYIDDAILSWTKYDNAQIEIFNSAFAPIFKERYGTGTIANIYATNATGAVNVVVEVGGARYSALDRRLDSLIGPNFRVEIQNSSAAITQTIKDYFAKINDDAITKITELISKQLKKGFGRDRELAELFDVRRARDVIAGLTSSILQAPYGWDNTEKAWKGFMNSQDPDQRLNQYRALLSVINPAGPIGPIAGLTGKSIRRGISKSIINKAGLDTAGRTASLFARGKQIPIIDSLIGAMIFSSGISAFISATQGDQEHSKGIKLLRSIFTASLNKYSPGSGLPLIGLHSTIYDIVKDYPVPDELKFTAEEAIAFFKDAFSSLGMTALTSDIEISQFTFESTADVVIRDLREDYAKFAERFFNIQQELTTEIRRALESASKDDAVQQTRALYSQVKAQLEQKDFDPNVVDKTGVLNTLEKLRTQNINAVLDCLSSYDDKTQSLSGTNANTVINANKEISIQNWTRDEELGPSQKYFTEFTDFAESFLNDDPASLTGFIFGTVMTDREKLKTQKFYVQNAFPEIVPQFDKEIEKIATLPPADQEKAIENVDQTFDNIKAVLSLVAKSYLQQIAAYAPRGGAVQGPATSR